jgi:hypothetical protein
MSNHKLTDQQRHEIRRYVFTKEGELIIREHELNALFDMLEKRLLSFYWDDLFSSFTPSKQMKELLQDLPDQLDKILADADTLLAMDRAMFEEYPCPEWNEKEPALLDQDNTTAFVRPSRGAADFELVHIAELLQRIKYAAENVEGRKAGDKSRNREEVFVKQTAFILRATTGQLPTETKGGVLDMLLSILFEPFGGENESYSSMIHRVKKKYGHL